MQGHTRHPFPHKACKFLASRSTPNLARAEHQHTCGMRSRRVTSYMCCTATVGLFLWDYVNCLFFYLTGSATCHFCATLRCCGTASVSCTGYRCPEGVYLTLGVLGFAGTREARTSGSIREYLNTNPHPSLGGSSAQVHPFRLYLMLPNGKFKMSLQFRL